MRSARGLFLGLLAAVLLPGCGPSVPDSELGQIVYKIPDVSWTGPAYELPEAKPAAQSDAKAPAAVPITPPVAPAPSK